MVFLVVTLSVASTVAVRTLFSPERAGFLAVPDPDGLRIPLPALCVKVGCRNGESGERGQSQVLAS
jgi:hypothetical protein